MKDEFILKKERERKWKKRLGRDWLNE